MIVSAERLFDGRAKFHGNEANLLPVGDVGYGRSAMSNIFLADSLIKRTVQTCQVSRIWRDYDAFFSKHAFTHAKQIFKHFPRILLKLEFQKYYMKTRPQLSVTLDPDGTKSAK